MSKSALVTLEGAGVVRNGEHLLQDIDLRLLPREIVTIIGPNGAGKSTLVKLISGLLRATEGRVERRPRMRIGYMPQRLAFDPSLPLSVRRFLTLSRCSKQQLSAVVMRLRIEHLLTKAVQVLSGGELQRVLLARALLRQPDLLVLDEPVQGVDLAGQTELYSLIGQLRDELDCGIVMVSHDLHLVMAQTDRVICLNHHICCHGKPESVSNDPAYLQLFGQNAQGGIAVYTHQHDHRHDLDGHVIDHNRCNHSADEHGSQR